MAWPLGIPCGVLGHHGHHAAVLLGPGGVEAGIIGADDAVTMAHPFSISPREMVSLPISMVFTSVILFYPIWI
ncbi:MAG: hypothetical protein CSA23_01245 [Deltaproteobacteria bacterium]|nr:MAG: hypothetical protein CSA23_01245 [Deltaproteobacteria bacterium]